MIIVAGEALIDLLPVPGKDRQFTARPGGASLNVAVALARLGQPASFLGRIGSDAFGRMLWEQLELAGVDTAMTVPAGEATTLGVTSLDDRGKAEYTFYANGTADWAWTEREVPRELPAGARALYLGGLALRLLPGGLLLEGLMRRVRRQGSPLIFYDPNVRSGFGFAAAAERDRVERQLRLAHVVKASEDDIALLYPGSDFRQIAAGWQRMTSGIIIVTLGPAGAYALTSAGAEIEVPPVEVDVVDTVGAGDAFSAAMLDGLMTELPDFVDPAEGVARIGEQTTRRLLERASVSAAYTCGRAGGESIDARTLDYLIQRARLEQRAPEIVSDPEVVLSRDLSGAPLYHAGRHDVRPRLGGVTIDAAEQDLGSQRADGGDVLRDNGDRGVEQVRERHVVEAHERGLVLGAVRTQRTDSAEGDQVLPAEQGGRRLRSGQQIGNGGFRGTGRMQVTPHDAGILGQAGLAQRFPVPLIPLLRRRDRGQVAKEGDPPVPVSGQVADGRGRALPVVDHHAVSGKEDRRAVDEHECRAHRLLIAQIAVIPSGRDDDQAVDPACEQHSGQFALANRILVQAARQQAHPALPRHVLDRAIDTRRVRVAHILEHQADHE